MKTNIWFHSYADDTQLYPLSNLVLKPHFIASADIKNWMAEDFLKLNDTKAEVILPLTANHIRTHFNSHLLRPLAFNWKHSAIDYGALFDSDFKLELHMKKVAQIWKVIHKPRSL